MINLEKAIDEIAELNMGSNFKQTQKELQEARALNQNLDNRPTSTKITLRNHQGGI